MGTENADCLVISGYGGYGERDDPEWVKAVERVKRAMSEDGDIAIGSNVRDDSFLLGPVRGVNGQVTFFLAPDGSKEYWETSDRFDAWRSILISAVGRDAQVIWLGWGEIDGAAKIKHDSMVPYDPEDA